MQRMRHVAMECVVPGMVTARHVYPEGETSGLPLLAAHVTVTEAIRERLVKAQVPYLVVDDDLSEGIETLPPITDDLRRSALGVVRSTFTSLRTPDAILTRDQLVQIEATMNSIMAEISNRKSLLVCLSDLNRFGGERMQHAVNVCVVGVSIARKYFGDHGWRDFKGQRRDDNVQDRLQKLGVGLLLQDIGSLAIPDSIWQKRGILSAEERAMMQQHPLLGVEMLEGSDISPLTKVTIAQHHERYDGSGYPKGLAGDEIHDHGQVAAIAEMYVSLGDQRRADGTPEFAPHEAYRMILQARGRLFHPDMVDAFTGSVAPYGPGTCVQLSDGKYGIIVSNNANAPLRPVVRVTHDADGLRFMPPVEMDLANAENHGVDVAHATDGLPSDNTAQMERPIA